MTELTRAESAILRTIRNSRPNPVPFGRLNRAARLTVIGGYNLRERMQERGLIVRKPRGFEITDEGMRALGVRVVDQQAEG